MKHLFFLIFLSAFLFTACSDDDGGTPCDTTDVAAVLVGSWEETPIAGLGDEVTFNSDFSGSCTAESLFVTEANGDVSTSFTWTLSADATSVELDYPNGIGVTYNVVSVDCDEVSLELFGFTVRLTRK